MIDAYAISCRTDPDQPATFNALYAIPDDKAWRLAVDRWGDVRRFDSPHEAEAAAGHHLCQALNAKGEADE